MRLSVLFIILTCAFHVVGYAQDNVRVSGYITAADSGEPLIGATIYLPKLSYSAVTDVYGRYAISVPAKEAQTWQVSYVGFEPLDTILTLLTDAIVDFQLKGISLREIEITANATSWKSQHHINQVPIERLKAIPMLLGQPDVIKALSFLPGVSTGFEGTTGLYVRGGTPDQNLILLDGATVYNASHLFGFQSVFDPNAIKDIKFIKGGFPARYGGRLSSIIDITMKEGNKIERKGEFTFGLINSSLLLEGPIKKEKSAYMASARAAYLGLLLLPTYFASRKQDDKPFNTLLSYDLNFKVNHEFLNRDKIFFSIYLGQDAYLTQYKVDSTLFGTNLGWGNKTMNLRYIKSFSNNWFANTYLNFNTYNLREDFSQQNVEDKQNTGYFRQSNIKEWSLKQHFSTVITPSFSFFGGVEIQKSSFLPVNAAFESLNYNIDSLTDKSITYQTISSATFVETEWQLSKWLYTNMGFRYLWFRTANKNYFSPEPRLSITAKTKDLSFNLSYTKMRQYLHLLSNNSLGLTSDLWVPITDNIAPQSADQFSGSVIFDLPKRKWEITVETFYKNLSKQIDFEEGTNFFDPSNLNWENIVEKEGKGKAYGLEYLMKYSDPKFNMWLSYTLSWNKRQFENINNGAWYFHQYDRRNNLSLTLDYRLKNNWRLSSNFVYQSGSWITLPTAFQIGGRFLDYISIEDRLNKDRSFPSTTKVITQRNNQRLPDYHRLDVSFVKTKTTKKRQRPAQWAFGIYNLYGRKNTYNIVFSGRATASPDIENITRNINPYGVAAFSIVPSIAYNLKW